MAEKRLAKAQSRVISQLMNYYMEWKGVPHCDGGMSKKGVDNCSFAYLTFREKFGIRLPRSTSQLANTGQSISRLHLQPGDLVFFKVTMGARHVGIYMGDQKFMHATKTDGVKMSSMDNPYWQKTYWQSRRVARL